MGLTVPDKILVAAARVTEVRSTFTAEDLVVEAWHQFPESFGLSGYRDRFPDSNRILCKLMGGTGLCSRGWIEKVSPETYRVTDTGRELATTLRASGHPASTPSPAATPSSPSPTAASKPVAPFGDALALERLSKSLASQKFSRGAALTLQDACLFWSVTIGAPRAQVEKRLEEIGSVLARAERYIALTGAAIVTPGGAIPLMIVVGLQGLNGMLTQRYSRELQVRAVGTAESADAT